MPMPFHRPLVALSLTDPDAEFLSYAAAMLDRDPAVPVRFLHVLAPRPGGIAGAARRSMAQASVEAAIRQHAPSLAGRSVVEIREGAPLDGVLQSAAADSSDVILLGHRRGRSGRRSLARRLASMAPSSVWLVPEGSAPVLSHMVVPTDFSEHSADALRFAIEMARERELGLLTSVHIGSDSSTSKYPEYAVEFEIADEDRFEDFLAEVDHAGVLVDRVFEDSAQPINAILDVALRTQSDLIVMSTRGRSAATAVLLGGVTSDVMAASPVPVLAVKARGVRA